MAERAWLRKDGDTHDVHATRTQPRVCTSHREILQSDHAHQSLPTQSKSKTFNNFYCQISLHNRVNNFCQKNHLPQLQLPKNCIFFEWHGDFTDSDHLSASDPFVTMPNLHRPSFWALPSLEPLIAFHFLFISVSVVGSSTHWLVFL